MSKIKMAINGFGRIGRNVFKLALERDNIEVIGVNDLTSTKTLAHLLKYDSTQGRFNGTIDFDETSLIVNGVKYPVTAERNPGDIAWHLLPMLLLKPQVFFVLRKAPKADMAITLKMVLKKLSLRFPPRIPLTVPLYWGLTTAI